MLFSVAVAEFGLSVIIWFACIGLAVLVAGAFALIKSEGAAAPPFVGFALGAFLAYYVVAVRHGFGHPGLIRWAPLGPSLGFAIGIFALWPWPRMTGLAVCGCMLLFTASGELAGGVMVLAVIAAFFSGKVPALATTIILGSAALSYYGRALPWLEAKEASEKAEREREQYERDQRAAASAVMAKLFANPQKVIGLTSNDDPAIWSQIFAEKVPTEILSGWDQRIAQAIHECAHNPVAVEQLARTAYMILLARNHQNLKRANHI